MNKAQVDNIEKRHGNSGKWLLEHKVFLDWVDQKSAGVLWCPGNREFQGSRSYGNLLMLTSWCGKIYPIASPFLIPAAPSTPNAA